MQALITPEKVATRMPFLRLNSLMVACCCSTDISRSLDIPALPAKAMPPQADRDAEQDHLSRSGVEHLVDEFAVEDGRHDRAKGGTVAERDRHAERHPQVAHAEPEGEASDSPHHAPEVAPEEGGIRCFPQHPWQIAGQDHAQRDRRDDPAEEATDQPVRLPGPALHAAVGNIETAGCQSAQPVKEYAQNGIRCHMVEWNANNDCTWARHGPGNRDCARPRLFAVRNVSRLAQ